MKVKFTSDKCLLVDGYENGEYTKRITNVWDTNTPFCIEKGTTTISHKNSGMALLFLDCSAKKVKKFLSTLYEILSTFEAVEIFEESIDLLWESGNKGEAFSVTPHQLNLLVGLRVDIESDSIDLNSSEDLEKYEKLVQALKDAMVKFKEENNEY